MSSSTHVPSSRRWAVHFYLRVRQNFVSHSSLVVVYLPCPHSAFDVRKREGSAAAAKAREATRDATEHGNPKPTNRRC